MKKDSLIGRIPIQVKGKQVKPLEGNDDDVYHS